MADETVTVGGRRLRIGNLDKVLYPATGTTKGELLAYYQQVASAMLPHLRDRPVTRKRWVHGVGTDAEPGEAFFAKDLEQGAPDWVARRAIVHAEGSKDYPLVQDAATLAWLGQMAAIELHVPQWRFAGDERLPPDRLVLDLDPGEGAGLAECQRVAVLAKELLDEIGLRPLPVTSGSKGLHLYAPLDGTLAAAEVAALAKAIATSLEELHPDLVVSTQRKAQRVGRVLVDWSQNDGRKTTIAPYSMRGRTTPTVAAPRTWEEVDGPPMQQLEWHEVVARLERHGDLLAALAPAPPIDRLAAYRDKRTASATPEPVPASAPPPTFGQSFVIHEHHASRLHWDLRLEHDGVLESWAVPKGIPPTTARNHLAVRTEDHPLEYAAFEGTIPAGQYGAGTMRIWDAGSYRIKDWEDDLVVVTLAGRQDGGLGGVPTRIALVRTDGDQWLCHRMELPRTVPRRTPAALSPMLASTRPLTDVDPADWVFEPKWDGWRTLVLVDEDGIRLRSRRGTALDDAFSELLEPIREAVQARTAILDGELVAGDAGGDFAALQGRLAHPGRGAAPDRADEPVSLMLFDVLEVDGASLVDAPLAERRKELEAIVAAGDVVHVTPQLRGSPAAMRTASERLGIEGLVAKRLASTYQPGRRSDDWRKIVHVRTHELAVVGMLPGEGELQSTFGSLVLAAPDADGTLRYAGRVGTGFSAAERARLVGLLDAGEPLPLELPQEVASSVCWVRPRVGEVRFVAVTDAGSLRQPVWRGLRDDKTVDDLQPLPRSIA